MWVGNKFEVEIVFIRHGKTKSNEEKKYISFTDEPLSKNGETEIKQYIAHDLYETVEHVFVSSRKRTKETAKLIYPLVAETEIDKIDEINFGVFEGKNYQQLEKNQEYIQWLDSGGCSKIRDGEGRDEFICRQLLGFEEILYKSKDYGRVAVVCHGGTIMSIVSNFTNLEYYDCMVQAGEKISCRVVYEIEENDSVSVSHFSIINRDNT